MHIGTAGMLQNCLIANNYQLIRPVWVDQPFASHIVQKYKVGNDIRKKTIVELQDMIHVGLINHTHVETNLRPLKEYYAFRPTSKVITEHFVTILGEINKD